MQAKCPGAALVMRMTDLPAWGKRSGLNVVVRATNPARPDERRAGVGYMRLKIYLNIRVDWDNASDWHIGARLVSTSIY